MRTRKAIAGMALSVPLLVAWPGQASAQCANGVNASVFGNANQSNECTTVVVTPGVPDAPDVPDTDLPTP